MINRENIQIVQGTWEDIEDFIGLLYDVRAGMENKEWFYLDTPEEFRDYMRSGSMMLWLARDGDRVAAAFNLLIPELRSYNYGYVLGYSTEDLMKVVNMDTAAVHPDYRGLGLQRKLLQTAEAWLKGRGERILLCTIHPENRFSLENALKQGYAVQKQVDIYGSVRYLLRKDI